MRTVGFELPCAFQCVADGVDGHDRWCPAHYQPQVDAALRIERERYAALELDIASLDFNLRAEIAELKKKAGK